jgi:hypothetical protein
MIEISSRIREIALATAVALGGIGCVDTLPSPAQTVSTEPLINLDAPEIVAAVSGHTPVYTEAFRVGITVGCTNLLDSDGKPTPGTPARLTYDQVMTQDPLQAEIGYKSGRIQGMNATRERDSAVC